MWSRKKFKCQGACQVAMLVWASIGFGWAQERKPPPSDRGRPVLSGAIILHTNTNASTLPPGYQLLYEQNFAKASAIKDFALTDASAWKVTFTNGNGALELLTQSKYQPSVRSPVNIALIKDKVFEDFVLEADLI